MKKKRMEKVVEHVDKGISAIVWIILAVFLGVVMILAFMGSRGKADAHEQVCFCHDVLHNPHTICTDNSGQINGHTTHVNNGTDTFGACQASPTPTATPTVTPTPTPIVACDGECEPTPTPTATPSATPTPESCRGNCGNPPTFAGSSTEAPQCGSTAPDAVVNPHVYRNGDKVIVKWWPEGGNKVHIYYKQVSASDWQYSVTVPNTGYAEISGLGTMDISFAVQAVNDCSGGASVISKVIVDGNASHWVLFR